MGEYSMADALKSFLQGSRLKGAVQAAQVEEAWKQIMGTAIAGYTDKIEIRQNTLFITTSVAALKQELHYQKDKIIERVNETLGERVIHEVVIR